MSNIIVVTGGTNTGKSELLTKLYETILRWYDNYELTIEKQPINSLGDFLADITIKRNKPLKDANEKKYPNDISTNNEEDCCKNNPQQNDKKDSIRILINTAGDELGNFNQLKDKLDIDKDYDFLIIVLKKTNEDLGKSLEDIYSNLKPSKKGDTPIADIDNLFKSFDVQLSNNYHKVREKNLICVMKEIVCYTYNNLK